MCMVETPYTSFMDKDLEKHIQDIKYTLETIIGLIAMIMLMQIAIAFLIYLLIST